MYLVVTVIDDDDNGRQTHEGCEHHAERHSTERQTLDEDEVGNERKSGESREAEEEFGADFEHGLLLHVDDEPHRGKHARYGVPIESVAGENVVITGATRKHTEHGDE